MEQRSSYEISEIVQIVGGFVRPGKAFVFYSKGNGSHDLMQNK